MATRVPEVQFQPVQGGNFTSSANAELLGGPEARNLQALGKNLQDIGSLITKQKNQDNLNTVLKQDILFGDVLLSEQRRYLQTKGKNAEGILGQAEAMYDRNFEILTPADDGEIDGLDIPGEDVGEFE